MQPILDNLLDNSDPNVFSNFNIPEINEILNFKGKIRKHIPKFLEIYFPSIDYLIQKYFTKSNWNEFSLINTISESCFTSPNYVRYKE